MAKARKEAEAAFGLFVETCGVNCGRSVEKLAGDRDELLCSHDFPCEHWNHIRTAKPVESVFSTVRHRTRKTRGCPNGRTVPAMVFKLMMSAKGK